jgi:hypothetical protein
VEVGSRSGSRNRSGSGLWEWEWGVRCGMWAVGWHATLLSIGFVQRIFDNEEHLLALVLGLGRSPTYWEE